METRTKCPWPKSQTRETVERAIERVGGRKAFDFLGRGVQEAVIDQALFFAVQDAARFGQPLDFDQIVAARSAAYVVAGLWED